MKLIAMKAGLRCVIVVPIGAIALTLASQTSPAQMETNSIVVMEQHPTGHVHDHDDQTWPPQPRGISRILDFSDPSVEQKRSLRYQERFRHLEQQAVTRADFLHALGKRFHRIDVVTEPEKEGVPQVSRFTYFSLDNNATVEVTFDGTTIHTIRSIPARRYQPEITDEEIAEATQLARAYFLSRGLTRVQELQGYGILAYRPKGKGFYNRRVIYISFHEHGDAPPEFVEWVDLTNQKILKAREEHQ